MTLTDALQRLHAAGRIAAPWRPGMLLEEVATPGNALWRHPMRLTEGWPEPDAHLMRVVLTDAATVGVLMALLREAIRDPTAIATPLRSGAWSVDTRAEGYDHWLSDLDHRNRHPHRPTEGEAIAATLIACAEEVGS